MQSDFTRLPINLKIITDFFSRITIHPWVVYNGTPCWLWIGNRFKTGYAALFLNGNQRRAHRIGFGLFVHEIAKDRHADHLCRRPQCVNPIHIEDVTPRVNTERGNAPSAKNMQKTHCLHGHPFDKENTYNHPDGSRQCRTCRKRENVKRWHRLYPQALYRNSSLGHRN